MGRANCRALLRAFVVACMVSTAGPLSAADWFVAAGSIGGDGTKAKPFHDPWRALAVASSGDVIHIVQGVYHGRHDRSVWIIDRPRITMLGGYDRDFTKRDPWKQPTVLAFYADYEGINEGNFLIGADDHSGVVIDGLVIDGGGRNRYDPKPPMALRGGLGSVGSLVSFMSNDVVIRNCVLINSLTGAAELRGEGCRFENNIVLNHQALPMLVLREAPGAKRPIVVKGNTFAFAYDDSDPPMGKGGEKGTAIRVSAAAQIDGNVFVACGNNAIALYTKAERVAIDRNVFWLPLRANVSVRDGVKEYVIADKNLEEMEDLGFKSSTANRAADAGLTGLQAPWIDGVTRHLLLAYAAPPREGIAALRKRYELGEPPAPTGDDVGPAAPYVAPAEACALRVQGDAGARPVELPVKFSETAAAPPLPPYTRVEWSELHGAATANLEGKAIEVRVALGHERHGFMLKGITQEGYLGFDVMHPGDDRFPDQIHVFALRNGPTHRQWQEAEKSNNAREAEDWYLIRGTARLTGALRQKVTIQVDAVVPTEAPPSTKPARPRGRDWFVRVGATGGDGTREKPYRDPFQPLEKASAGDTIHVAAGDYFGKLRSASWKVTGKHIALLGGYDADFKSRDPWKHPTRLVMSPDVDKADKAKHSGEFLESSDINDGFVLDGFVFDGASVNTYFDAGAGSGLSLRGTPIGAMVQLRGPDLTIRNCVLTNASGLAVDLGSASGVLENNIIVNSSGTAVNIVANGPGPWHIRNNTFLFALDPSPRAGTGMSTGAGSLLLLRGRAAMKLEGNLLAFADNYAVRATVPRNKLIIDGNVFGANLHCHLTDADRTWLHDATWDRRLADAAFQARDNVNVLPSGLPIDQAYIDKVLPRLFELKGRYPRDAWVRIASSVGATVVPPPETAPVVVVEKPKEKPKAQSLEDLMAELDKLKSDSAKQAETVAPKGPPYAPAYDWQKAMQLAQDPSTAKIGARRVTMEGVK